VNAQCLPFARIPHTTRLFTDFISASPQLQQFYPRSPYFQQWFQEEASQIGYEPHRRARVSSIVESQNREWNASARTMENIARLRSGASVIVTGQQVGLFGGPLFSIFKALSAVKLAAEATAGGVETVPVFWLATTDHDLAEVSHVSVPGPDGTLIKLSTASHSYPDAPVGTVMLGGEIEPVLAQALELLGDSEASGFLKESYRPGETLGSSFARLFARVFADWGVILLDASDPELHAIAKPMYAAAIEHAAELDEALLERGKQLDSAGYHQQVKVTSATTLLFALQQGARTSIHRRGNGTASNGLDFTIAEEKISRDELLSRIAASPEQFSANVLLRPVVQDYLLPTLAYTGGAAEVAYFAQVGVVYEKLLGRITPILPRVSATLVESKVQRILEKYRLEVSDAFQSPEKFEQIVAARKLPGELQLAFDQGKEALDKALSQISEKLAALDQTLLEAAKHASSKIQHQFEQLRSRAARAEALQSEVIRRHASFLTNTLYPHNTLQEREVGAIYFLSRYGQDLLRQLYEAMHTDCHDHQLIQL